MFEITTAPRRLEVGLASTQARFKDLKKLYGKDRVRLRRVASSKFPLYYFEILKTEEQRGRSGRHGVKADRVFYSL